MSDKVAAAFCAYQAQYGEPETRHLELLLEKTTLPPDDIVDILREAPLPDQLEEMLLQSQE